MNTHTRRCPKCDYENPLVRAGANYQCPQIFQNLGEDLLRVSMSLDSLERGSMALQSGDSAIGSQEEERRNLKKKKESLEAQLQDSKTLSVEVRERRYWDSGCHFGFSYNVGKLRRRKSHWCCWRKIVKLWMQLWSLKTAVYKKDKRC